MVAETERGVRRGPIVRRFVVRAVCLLVACCVCVLAGACWGGSTLPAALSDAEFSGLMNTLSEPPGVFALSDNLVSNEPHYADTIQFMRATGGAYIGVGPEQNFSYMVALRPRIAFILDIRRENLALHLLYKAVFELSSDRVEFVSMLFSRPRPADLEPRATVDEIFDRYDRVAPSAAQFTANTARIRTHLLSTRGLTPSDADLQWIDLAFGAFYTSGPAIDYYGANKVDAVRPSYRDLMTAKDFGRRPRSFLASEAAFRFVKDLQARNLIVPVVGDVAGPTAMRRIGAYVSDHRDRVRAVYGSNVGVYLTSQQTIAFCRNLAALPATTLTWFIDSNGRRLLDARLRQCPKYAE
jgi:hypothetical protein